MISRVKEELFYEKTVEQYPDLKQWIAGYHGTKEIHMEGIDGKFMILDDLTFGYDKPSVIDLKIGTQTWEEDASKEKIERESKKYPLQRTFGFRLTGMRVYNKEKKDYDIYDKKYGYSITEDTLNGMFALLANGQLSSSLSLTNSVPFSPGLKFPVGFVSSARAFSLFWREDRRN